MRSTDFFHNFILKTQNPVCASMEKSHLFDAYLSFSSQIIGTILHKQPYTETASTSSKCLQVLNCSIGLNLTVIAFKSIELVSIQNG